MLCLGWGDGVFQLPLFITLVLKSGLLSIVLLVSFLDSFSSILAWRLPGSVQWAVTAKTLKMQC